MLLSSPFIAFSVYDLWFNDVMPNAVSWLSLCFFGLALPIGIFILLDKRPQITVNSTGIFDRTAYKDFINWNIIDSVYLSEVHQQKFICLIVKAEFKHLIKRRGKLSKLNTTLGFQEINISISQLDMRDEERLAEFIVAMSQADLLEKNRLLKHGPIK
jgi:hypothetical protein